MSSAWLSRERRNIMWSSTHRIGARSDLLQHAVLADQIIHELATALRQQVGLHYEGWTDPGNAMTNARAVLARVDALGGHDE